MLDIVLFLLVCIFIILIWIILYDSNRFVVRQYTLKNRKLKKNIHFVVLADLHNKCYGKNNVRLIQAIHEQKPDFIIVAGDILTAVPNERLDIAIDFIKELSKDYTIYYGSGNHEHRLKLYPKKYGDMSKIYETALMECGVKRLVNSNICLPEAGIAIFGSEIAARYYKRFKTQNMSDDYLEQIMGKPYDELFNILIAHNPDYFKNYAKWGADLVLSGHVHGGIVRIPIINRGLLSPSVTFFPKYDGGIYFDNKSSMILSRGLGGHTIPIRLFNPAELVVVDLESE